MLLLGVLIASQVLLVSLFRAGVLTDASRSLSSHASRWTLGAAIGLQVLVAVGLVRWLERRRMILSVESDALRFQSRRISFLSITRLGFYQPAAREGLSGWYSVETGEGQVVRFNVHPRDHSDGKIAAAVEAIANRSRRPWIGRSVAKNRFRDLLAVIRGAGGGSWNWLARNSVTIQSHAAELNDPVYRWTTPLFYVPLVAILLTVGFILTPGARLSYGNSPHVDSGLALIPRLLILGLILGWVCMTIGVNALVVLMRTQTRNREALEAEMSAAREVQMRLLPAAPPPVPGFALSAVCLPALEVGGDYYDFISTRPSTNDRNGNLVIAIGDVSGKGLPAALMMTMVKGSLTTALQSEDLAAAVSLLNHSILQASPGRTFVTLALASISASSNRVRILRAGHPSPLLLRSGQTEWISPQGPALGMRLRIDDTRRWETVDLELGRTDLLLLYTDGVTEEVSPAGEQYGQERLAALVRANGDLPLEDLKQAILADVRTFRATPGVTDDLTLVLIRRE